MINSKGFFIVSFCFATPLYAANPQVSIDRQPDKSILSSLLAESGLSKVKVNDQASQTYLKKFLTYTQWCQHLPRSVDPEFLAFIDKPTPLTHKLREKWLYQLAYNKDWLTFSQYYTGSTDTTLQCYALTALYNQGKTQAVQDGLAPLWLNGGSQPKACDNLFTALLNTHQISDSLIQNRIALALENNNLSLARYLLKQLKPARTQDAELLSLIHQNPKHISQLHPGPLQGEFYLYGLKLMLPRNIDAAIEFSESAQAKKIMNNRQKQTFLANVALYKAMRDQPDAQKWFQLVKPTEYNDTLLEWEMRYALIHRHWQKVIDSIDLLKTHNEPSHLYWKARALNELGQKDRANELYRQLSTHRNYYGFLASLKLKKRPSFESEPTSKNQKTLLPYKQITDQIQTYYVSHQIVEASRLLNDFVSELPKNDKSALAFWLANDLHWYGKSIYLGNSDDLNNQLTLRFPLAHWDDVQKNARAYQISKELIYAVIRQESSFNDDIMSSAGANGLMQIMPGTAYAIAKRAHIAYHDKKQLFTPHKNINIGTAYLQQLAKQFHQHPVLMMAAYNAGPKQVNYWIKNHAPKEIDIWIETLPWRETRNYLKNIISFYAVYQYRTHEKLSLNEFMQPF